MKKYLLTICLLLTAFWSHAQYYVLNEQFIDGDSDWTLSNEMYVHKGVLNLSAYLSKATPNMRNEVTFPIAIEENKDFTIETSFIHSRSGGGGLTNYFGIKFGMDEAGRGYLFDVTHQGEFIVLLPDGTTSKWKSTPHMKRYRQNKLQVKKAGQEIRFILNGYELYKTTFQAFAGNVFGLRIGDKNDSRATGVRVDYLTITQPSSPDYSDKLPVKLDVANPDNHTKRLSFFNWEALVLLRVKQELNRWKEKGEFESSVEHFARVDLYEQKMFEKFSDMVLRQYEAQFVQSINYMNYHLHRYDPDAQTFKISLDNVGDINLKVPLTEAPEFKKGKQWLMFQDIDLELKDNQWVVKYVEVHNTYTNKKYVFDRSIAPGYNPVSFTPSLDDLEIDVPSID